MSQTSALIIVLAAIFTNNILLSNFLGMCSFLACSRQIGTAVGLGAAVTFVTTATTMINYGIYHGILVKGAPLLKADLTHLTFIVFIAVIAAFVQTVGFGVGAGVGWALAIVLMAGLRQKMGYSSVPRPFRGVAITMIITGVMALAFMGFAGMVSIQ